MTDYRFPVEREPLVRADGVDTRYDALYRGDTGDQLSVVSRDYQLITHAEAVDAVYGYLDALGEPYEEFRAGLTNQGKRLFAEVKLPHREFDIDGDGIQPSLVVENSLDKTRSLSTSFGAFRLICSNGAIIGRRIVNINLTHYRNNIDLDKILYAIDQGIHEGIEFFANSARDMINVPAGPTIQEFLENENYPVLFRYMVAEEMMKQELANFEMKKVSNVEKPVEVTDVSKEVTQYLFWNILTQVATHRVVSQGKRVVIDRAIAKQFFG